MFGSLLLPTIPSMAAPSAAERRASGATTGIDQLAFLIGGTWVAKSEIDGKQMTIAETCTWGLDEQCITTQVVQRSGGLTSATARGFFGWDPSEQELVSTSFTSIGTFNLYRQTAGKPAPPTWIFEGVTVGLQRSQGRITMCHEGPDLLRIAQQVATGNGSYGSPVSLLYHRHPTP